jgi:TatD DNase family protein
MLFDTHCHLNAEQFEDDLEAVIQRAREAGVTDIVVPGVDAESSRRAIAIAEQHEGIYAAVGVHPEVLDRVSWTELDTIAELASHPKVVAIGEIGLDYYWNVAPREVQQEWLRRQIELAAELRLPVVIHNRDATADTVSLLEETCPGRVTGVMHCFTGSYEIAQRCIKIGFFISYGGPVTFKNAHNVRETAARIPLDRLVVETDSPYLTPHPYRGKRNEPARVRLVAEKLAELHGRTVEEIEEITYANALRLFPRAAEEKARG